MSHHHHHQYHEPGEPQPVETVSKSMNPLFDKNDLSFLALIKPLLSPNGQKIVDLVLLFGGISFQENQLDIPGLLSQLNITGDNNSTKELLSNLINSINNQENKTNPNLAMLSSLISSLSQKNTPEES